MCLVALNVDILIHMLLLRILSYLLCHWRVKINKREIWLYAISLLLYNSTSFCFIILLHLVLSFQPPNLKSNLFSMAAFADLLCHLNPWLKWCHLYWFLYIKFAFLHQILRKVWPKKIMLGACRTVIWAACHSLSLVSDWWIKLYY